MGIANRYADEVFEIVEIEKSFIGEIRNPKPDDKARRSSWRQSRCDRPVHDGLYLLEH